MVYHQQRNWSIRDYGQNGVLGDKTKTKEIKKKNTVQVEYNNNTLVPFEIVHLRVA